MAKCSLGQPDEELLKWYLRDRYFDVEEAEQKLTSMLRWRQRFQPGTITIDSVRKEYDTGKGYVHTHSDVYGRPAIIIRCKRHVVGQFPFEDSQRLCVFNLDTAMAKLDKEKGQEQILGIFDLRGFGAENADFKFAAFMVEAFFVYYPRRVSQVLFVDAPWVFYPAWKVIKPLMRKYAALVRFVSTEELRKEFFTPETLPADFK